MAGGRFVTMDGVRGVAALSVLTLHLTIGPSGVRFPMANFAVDVFFCLSGFVLASAFEARLAAGMSALSFARLRWIRLYPMYFVGLTIGIVNALVALRLGAPAVTADRFALEALLGLALAPSFSQFQFGFHYVYANVVFPFNFVCWSLLCELVVNVMFARWRPKGRALAILLGVSLLGFIATTLIDGKPCGFLASSLAGGVVRAVLLFYAGLALYRAWAAGRLPNIRFAWGAPAAVAAICLLSPDSPWLFVAVAAIGAPLIVVLSLEDPRSPGLRKLYSWLGKISFPLYAVHEPAYALFRIGYDRLVGAAPLAAPPLIVNVLFTFVLLGLCTALADRVDGPARKMLTRFADRVAGVSRSGAALVSAPAP